jgi:hypothetical protein
MHDNPMVASDIEADLPICLDTTILSSKSPPISGTIRAADALRAIPAIRLFLERAIANVDTFEIQNADAAVTNIRRTCSPGDVRRVGMRAELLCNPTSAPS